MSSEKRDRQKANRAAKIAAQQAAARARRRRLVTIWTALAVVVAVVIWLVIQLGGGDASSTSTTEAASTSSESTTTDTTPAIAAGYDDYRAQPTACGADAPEERTEMSFDAPDDLALEGTVTATIETSCGPIEIALDAAGYPETVNSFAFLAREGYFDGTVCHRVSAGFMIQCGDPTATGTGGPGYTVPDEFPDEGFTYERGVVAMANAGAGTTGSQFFIVTGDASHLGPQFSVLGTVVGGEDTLDLLEQVPVGLNAQGTEVSNPTESIYLESVTVG